MRRTTATPAARRGWPVLAALAAIAAGAAEGAALAQAPGWSPASAADRDAEPEEVIIRLLPPAPGRPDGATRVETLLSDPEVHNVVFRVDGEIAARRRSPPWAATVQLAVPPREQRIRAEALDADDRLLAADEIVVNRAAKRLAVSLRSIEPTPSGLEVRAVLSLPRGAELDRLEAWVDDELRGSWSPAELAALRPPGGDAQDGDAQDGDAQNRAAQDRDAPDGELALTLDAVEPDPQTFVRLVAHLVDGRSIEDVALAAAAGFTEEIDVQLVQLQVVVTNKRGLPMRGLQKRHFRILENGRERQAAGLFPADDVSLLLGLALDSSGSMRPIWRRTRQAASTFLDETLRARDEGFLVDFDTRLRLLQGRTADHSLLHAALDELRPEGGTALYDSILFSLLQFDGQQGRRGLVVLTDGYDIDSQADPERAIEFGQRLGVPVYILALDDPSPGPGNAGRRPRRGISAGIGDAGAAVQTLRLLTDPTGGRLYRVGSPEQIARAFNLIQAELRNQYVLTYYTDTPPEPGRPPKVEIDAPGHPGLRAKVVFGEDQVY